MALEFGTCPCGGHYERRTVEVRLTAEGRRLLLTDVPQGTCPMCGSRVYKRDDLQRIEALMKQQRGAPARAGQSDGGGV